ncbi:MAG: hypothetical protein IJO46_11300 [Thermoguttaceae bacterium]|nr:hypothetical protein [Thermoguttaceae bacterium]
MLDVFDERGAGRRFGVRVLFGAVVGVGRGRVGRAAAKFDGELAEKGVFALRRRGVGFRLCGRRRFCRRFVVRVGFEGRKIRRVERAGFKRWTIKETIFDSGRSGNPIRAGRRQGRDVLAKAVDSGKGAQFETEFRRFGAPLRVVVCVGEFGRFAVAVASRFPNDLLRGRRRVDEKKTV